MEYYDRLPIPSYVHPFIRRGAAIITATALATGCAAPERSTSAAPTTSTPVTYKMQGPVAPQDFMGPVAPTPEEEAAYIEDTQIQANTDVLVPSIEAEPFEKIGVMTVSINGSNTQEFPALPRTREVTHALRAGDTEGNVDPSLDKGFSYHLGLPGQPGTTVIGGHRVSRVPAEYGHTHVLYDVDKIKTNEKHGAGNGDTLMITLDPKFGGTAVKYQAVKSWIVNSEAAGSIFDQDPNKSVLRIYTCHPKRSAAQRYIVEYHLI